MQLQARIVVMTKSVSKPFYYTHDLDEVKEILSDIPVNSLGEWDIEAGKKIVIQGQECTIESFEVRVYKETQQPHNYGINLYREGESLPYNLDLIILVNDESINLRMV